MFNWVVVKGKLPFPRWKLLLLFCLKREDLLKPSSNRPITLLCMDVKKLVKVLAARLNKIIQKLIKPDQSGFIPNRSTSTNIGRVYLNLQIPTVNVGSMAILSLDVANAFYSLE